MSVGDLLAGRYLLREQIGSSGTGITYWAEDQDFGHSVALTVTNPATVADPRRRSLFLREARALARVRHPNVVTVFEVDEQAGFLTTELFEGSDLGQLLSAPRRLATTWVAHLADQLAAGLDAAHARELVHRDVSPANIMLEGENDVPVLCNFVLAGSAVNALGSQLYKSPEQLRNEPATQASDIYALGCVLFHCLAGRPFPGAARRSAGAGPGSDVRAFAPALAEAVQDVLQTCLATSPRDRFPTAGAAATALRSALAQRQQHSVQERPSPPPPATARTSRALLAGCVAVVLAAGITGGVAGVRSVEPGDLPSAVAVLSAPDAELLAMLPPSVYGRTCTPLERTANDLAVVSCTSVPGGGVDQLIVYRWRDTPAMKAAFQASYVRSPAYAPGQCSMGNGRHSQWQQDGQTVGGLACGTNGEGSATLTWEYDDRAVQVLAVRADRDSKELYQWWDKARRTPLN